jgi:hypothetical protein
MRGFLIVIAAAMATAISASAAAVPMMQSYSGSWPLTVTHSQRSNGTYCLTLTDSGYFSWRHSGGATLVTSYGGKLTNGTFQVIDHTLVATIQQPGAYQNAALVFTAPAEHGAISRLGVYEQVYGGEESDSGVLMVGMKGHC